MNDREDTDISSKVTESMWMAERVKMRVSRVMLSILLITLYSLLFINISYAGIHDRVAAFVDDQAITMSELQEQFRSSSAISSSITEDEVLTTMINRIVLLKEAKKYRIEAPTVEEVLKQYIDLKIRALIRVSDSDIEKFYRQNMQNFSGREYEDVRDEIDQYLTEKYLNERLKENINELKKKSYIKIMVGQKR